MNIFYEGGIFSLAAVGGIQRYHICLTNHLSANHQATFVVPRNRANDITNPRCNRIELKTSAPIRQLRGVWNRFCHYRVQRITERQDFDLEHWTYYAGICGRPIRRGAKPLVVTVHDFIHEAYPSDDPDGNHRRWKRDAIAAADQIICVSEFTMSGLVDAYPEAAEKARVVWHGNTLRDVQSAPLPSAIRNRPFVFYVGRRDGYKNFAALLAAWNKASHARDVALVVVGPTWQAWERETFVREHSPNNLILVPNADDSIVRSLYEACAAFVFPTRMEGFGFPALEAMECGAPLLLSDCQALREVAGSAGHYFGPDDVDLLAEMIVHAVDERLPRQAERVASGIARAKQFSWERAARETEQIYGDLVRQTAWQDSPPQSAARAA